MFVKALEEIVNKCTQYNARLVAVSKTRSAEEIQQVYNSGIRDFGENYAAEMKNKHKGLPKDICWHFIGHLQRNKTALISPYVHLIHSVDRISLLNELEKEGLKHNRIISCLLQVHIAREETKFGILLDQLNHFVNEIKTKTFPHISIKGLMGMATLTDDKNQIRSEFRLLKKLFDGLTASDKDFTILSMGMTSDYEIALDEGSTMVRIGSAIFGERN